MIIEEIKDKNIWENFLLGCDEKTFLQSWNWGEFNQKTGKEIWRSGIFEDDKLVSVALIIKNVAKRGTYLNIPHGPITINGFGEKKEILSILLDELKKIGKKEKADFIRIGPIWERNEENEKSFKDNGFKKAPMHENTEASWKLDITPSEEDLLKNMRKTTRYLIRQAQKDENIETFQRWDISDVETFNKIHQEVVKTQKFVPFSLKYFKNEFSAFNKDNQISIFFGRYKGEIISASYVIFWSNIGFYHHAALLPQYHKIPISYLLLWEAIKEAKNRRCDLFDFWGYVNPEKEPKHPWAGPTLFKMGFGGNAFEYVKTQDFPLSKKYWLTYIFETLRKIKRGL